jgi:hypothetical protein
MKYYAACVDDTGISAACLMPPKQILLSYHYYKNKKDKVKQLISNGYDIFLDSGAFSAMNSGKEINIDEYCKYIKEVGAVYYASLDVIGDANATLINLEYMIDNYKLNPIPTFHMGSKIEDLKPLLKYDYIALGGLVFSSGIMHHCDEVWHYILTNKPKLKVHGFGLTNIELMARYPWYSVDSSSFQGCRRFGRQNLLYSGFNFKTFTEDEFLDLLEKGFLYDKEQLKSNNKMRIYLEDLFAVNSIKQYAQHLHELNKYRDFKHLTQQTKLF